MVPIAAIHGGLNKFNNKYEKPPITLKSEATPALPAKTVTVEAASSFADKAINTETPPCQLPNPKGCKSEK